MASLLEAITASTCAANKPCYSKASLNDLYALSPLNREFRVHMSLIRNMIEAEVLDVLRMLHALAAQRGGKQKCGDTGKLLSERSMD